MNGIARRGRRWVPVREHSRSHDQSFVVGFDSVLDDALPLFVKAVVTVAAETDGVFPRLGAQVGKETPSRRAAQGI